MHLQISKLIIVDTAFLITRLCNYCYLHIMAIKALIVVWNIFCIIINNLLQITCLVY